MRQNSVEVAAWKYVNLLSIRERFTIIFWEVIGLHDMGAIEKKNHNLCILIFIYNRGSTKVQ